MPTKENNGGIRNLMSCSLTSDTIAKKIAPTLFRNKRFMLDEKFQGNASKFAIFLENENLHSFFHFSFLATVFFPNECPGLCQHRPGIH